MSISPPNGTSLFSFNFNAPISLPGSPAAMGAPPGASPLLDKGGGDTFRRSGGGAPSAVAPQSPFFLPLADPKAQLELAYRSLLETRNALVQAKIQEEQARVQYEALARYLNKQAGNDQAIRYLLQQVQPQQTESVPSLGAAPGAAPPGVSADPTVQSAKQQAALAQQQYLQDLYNMRQGQLQQQGASPSPTSANLLRPPTYTPSDSSTQSPMAALQQPQETPPPPYPSIGSQQQPMAMQPQQVPPGVPLPPYNAPLNAGLPQSPPPPYSYSQFNPMQPSGMPMQPPGPPPPYAPLDPLQQQQMAVLQQQEAQMAAMQQQQAAMQPPPAPPYGQPEPTSQQVAMPPFEQLNQALVQGDPASRWAALEQIGKQGFAPPDTYNILCALAKPNSPLLASGLPADKKRELRQAAFWTLALLDNAQNASVPAGTPFRDPSGKPMNDPKTGKPLFQLLPGLTEAMATLSNKKEDPQVQRASIQMLQELLKNRPGDPIIQGILKATASSDPNVKAMARQASLAKTQPPAPPPSAGGAPSSASAA